MKMPIDKDWYEKRAAAEGDLEIGAGRRAPPPAYKHCTCSCHRGSGIIHFVACCSPPPQPREAPPQSDALPSPQQRKDTR